MLGIQKAWCDDRVAEVTTGGTRLYHFGLRCGSTQVLFVRLGFGYATPSPCSPLGLPPIIAHSHFQHLAGPP